MHTQKLINSQNIVARPSTHLSAYRHSIAIPSRALIERVVLWVVVVCIVLYFTLT